MAQKSIQTIPTQIAATINQVAVEDQCKVNMTEYGMYTNLERMFCDLRDGLKPVHRRCLWALLSKKAMCDHGYKVGTSIMSIVQDFHPHGVSGDVMLAMVEDTNHLQRGCMYPLIEGYGNWGSHNQGKAADRYVSCRFSPFGQRILDTLPVIDMCKDYKGENDEPVAFMPRVPILFLNGTSGIGVAIANQSMPHNLTETINLLQDVLRGNALDWDLFWKHIKGPESEWGGYLLSTPEAVKKVYADGRGTLYYMCEHHYEDMPSGNKALVITGFCPNWLGDCGASYDKLKGRCDWLVTQGSLVRVADETQFEKIRLVIEFDNHHVIQKEILPLLKSSQSYSLYTTVRSPTETGEISVELTSSNWLELVSEWLGYWSGAELKLLKYQEGELYTKLVRSAARYIAVTNLDTVADALKDPKGAKHILMTVLNMNDEQAEYILDTPFRTLQRANEDKLRADYEKLQGEMEVNKARQSNLNEWLIEILEDFRKYDYTGRRLRIGETVPECPKLDALLWVRAEGDLLFKTANPPDKPGWSVAQFTEGMLTVNAHGIVGIWDTHHVRTTGTKNYKDPIALIPRTAPFFACVDGTGKGVILPTRMYTSGEYKAFKFSGAITKAVPIWKNDNLIILCKDTGESRIITWDDLYVTHRKDTQGWSFFGKKKNLTLSTYGPDDMLVDALGNEMSPQVWASKGSWKLGKTNAVMTTRKNFILTLEETIEFLKKQGDQVTRVIKVA